MYKISHKEKKKAEIYKHLHNGYRFAIIQSGKIIKCYRYELDAKKNAWFSQEIRSLSEILEQIDNN